MSLLSVVWLSAAILVSSNHVNINNGFCDVGNEIGKVVFEASNLIWRTADYDLDTLALMEQIHLGLRKHQIMFLEEIKHFGHSKCYIL